ncbi:VOC family protein [Cellulomonas sp. NS3]|uniref:VOC family protein n=1 Tax=Cellulomonas sp. NS3 TaxID=2973977 RepID=UPI002162C13D|nr:VOC family protein [Cellulomonas sp. NS3]
MTRGALHHVELWVTDLAASEATIGRLVLRLGDAETRRWATGVRYDLGGTYLVLEAGLDVSGTHERTRAGLNHLAFHAGTPDEVDALTQAAVADGWTLMFPERHPFAGGSEHRAAYLLDGSGFEVELVASTERAPAPGVVARNDAARQP